MVRSSFFGRFLIGAIAFLGLFSQFEKAFACDLMDDKVRYSCCCVASGDVADGCAMGGGCGDQLHGRMAGGAAMASDCCDVSYQEFPVAEAALKSVPALQVLQLYAPQPPPFAIFLRAIHVARPNAVNDVSTSFVHRFAGSETYLLTQRFRI